MAGGWRPTGRSQAGRTELAAGRPESAEETTETRQALAQRRVLYPASADAQGPRVELRLRARPNARRA